MRRADGWVMQGLGTAALVGRFLAALWLPGWVLAHVSDAIGAMR